MQILLALGYPLGEYAWGGQHRILPHGLRIGSTISIFLYAFMISLFLDKAEIIDWCAGTFIREYVYWGMVAYFGLGIPMNAISRSKKERIVMTPVVLLLFMAGLIIGLL